MPVEGLGACPPPPTTYIYQYYYTTTSSMLHAIIPGKEGGECIIILYFMSADKWRL